MQSMKFLRVLVSAVLLSFVFGCASHGDRHADRQSAGEYVDDAWITSKVKAAFVKDKALKAHEINVETYQGKVQLSGFVSDPGDVGHASDVARDIKGVTSVENNLQVK